MNEIKNQLNKRIGDTSERASRVQQQVNLKKIKQQVVKKVQWRYYTSIVAIIGVLILCINLIPSALNEEVVQLTKPEPTETLIPPTEEGVTEVGAYMAEDISFEDGSGRVTIAFEDIIDDGTIDDGIIDVIVLAKGLKPTANYEISLQGVVFGPEENVEIRFGTMVGATLFQPNEQGELYVSMKNPLRIINGEEVRVIVSENGKEVLRSQPFIVSRKTQQ